MVIATDATPTHWAFYFQGSGLPLSVTGSWLGSMCRAHTALQEFQITAMMLHRMAFHLSGNVVALHLDNSTAKAYLCNQGGTMSPFLSMLAYQVLSLTDKHGITLIPAYISTHLNVEANCMDASTQALRTYYQQEGASSYNLNEALDALVTLTDRSQKTVHPEQQKRFLELSNKPTLALYMGFPDQLIPAEIKNQRLQPFLPQGKGANPGPPRRDKEIRKPTSKLPGRDPNQGSRAPPMKRATPRQKKSKRY